MKQYVKLINYVIVVGNLSVLLAQIGWRWLPITLDEAKAIGIIGGADGPTTIFFTGTVPFHTVLFLLLLLMNVVVGIINVRRD